MFIIKQNDTLPNLEVQLIDIEGNPLNLDLCGVHFHMKGPDGGVKINRQATILDVEQGKVKVEWREGDTGEVGTYKCEFEINMPDGKILTVPNDGYFLIQIVPELA
jgi:hypothetical protein